MIPFNGSVSNLILIIQIFRMWNILWQIKSCSANHLQIMMCPNVLNVISWLRIIALFKKLLSVIIMGKRKQKKTKPHVVLKLLHGYRYIFCSMILFMNLVYDKFHFFLCISLITCYRSTNRSPDVWVNLETNWNHFYWLTGEIPVSLSIMCDKIKSKFIPYRDSGRRNSLDFRNQVSIVIYGALMKSVLFINSPVFVSYF